MKCLSIFNSTPDLSYLWMDKTFKQHLVQLGVSLSMVDPELNLKEIDEETILSLAGQFFNPLVNSNKYMREVNNAYQTMKCDNGFVFVMNQLSDLSLFCIAVCGDGEESELFMQRKINFFHRMLLFRFGPCAVDHLRPPYSEKRKKAWKSLDKWLSTWTTLCQQEQMFLVEALERLHVNHQLNSISLNLLGEILTKSNKDSTMHALLLVNNKLLGLYSSQRSLELCSSDILLLIILLKRNFRYKDEIIPKSIHRTPTVLCSSQQFCGDELLFKTPESPVNDRESTSSPNNLEYHSAPSTPVEENGFIEGFFTPRNSTVHSSLENETSDSIQNRFTTQSLLEQENKIKKALTVDCDLTMSDPEFESFSQEEEKENSVEISEVTQNIIHEDQESKNEEEIMNNGDDINAKINKDKIDDDDEEDDDEDKNETIEEIIHRNIFLHTNENLYAPYTAHCLLLGNSTVLVLLSQHRQMYLGFYIQNLLRCLNLMLVISHQKQLSYRVKLLDDCNLFVKKIQSFFLRTNDFQSNPVNRMGKFYKSFEKSWKSTQNADLNSFINSETISVDMDARLERNLVGLIKCAKDLFTQLFIFSDGQNFLEDHQMQMFKALRETAVNKLSHYNLFLNVRGQQNVTMTAYHNDFPGLVHFIYVNRTSDQLVAPTVNINMDSNNSIYLLIKQRIWDYWQYSETMLSNGYTSFIVRDGDFSYSYFIWFEDSLRKPMVSQKSLKELNENKPTGILSGNYYKNLICYLFPSEPKGSINCYELFCMHVGLVSNQFIVSSCKKLSRKLEGSGEVVIL